MRARLAFPAAVCVIVAALLTPLVTGTELSALSAALSVPVLLRMEGAI